ncbi:MAG TPA: SDR family oxidoreductase [Streptosporangiaceae bacterium]|nr:SDR family oxidoreductase [Streptosporangiaceae bacterium]
MRDAKRRVAIVPGGAAGIGAAVAGAFGNAGLAVAVFDVRPPAEQDSDRRAHYTVDVSVAEEVEVAVSAVAERFGRLDVVVNNAGILDCHAVDDTPEEVWDRVMAVNVKSVFLVSRAAIPHLRAAGGGSIVNISSVHAVATVPRLAAYAASKGAVISLSRQMAMDYADDGIRVNAVVVGSVDTQMGVQHGAAMARDGVVVAPSKGQSAALLSQPSWPKPSCSWRRPRRHLSPGRRSSSTAACLPVCFELCSPAHRKSPESGDSRSP